MNFNVQVLDGLHVLFFHSLLLNDMVFVVGLIPLVAIKLVLNVINLDLEVFITFSDTEWLILDLDVVGHSFFMLFSQTIFLRFETINLFVKIIIILGFLYNNLIIVYDIQLHFHDESFVLFNFRKKSIFLVLCFSLKLQLDFILFNIKLGQFRF